MSELIPSSFPLPLPSRREDEEVLIKPLVEKRKCAFGTTGG